MEPSMTPASGCALIRGFGCLADAAPFADPATSTTSTSIPSEPTSLYLANSQQSQVQPLPSLPSFSLKNSCANPPTTPLANSNFCLRPEFLPVGIGVAVQVTTL